MCWCVSLNLFWYCVVLMCGFFVDSFMLYLCTYGFGVFYSIEQVLVLGQFEIRVFHGSTYWTTVSCKLTPCS
jgi:hypothetical protein